MLNLQSRQDERQQTSPMLKLGKYPKATHMLNFMSDEMYRDFKTALYNMKTPLPRIAS